MAKQPAGSLRVDRHVPLATSPHPVLQPGQDWGSIIGGAASPGNRWRLVFTTGAKVNKAVGGGKGSGAYFPLTGEHLNCGARPAC